MAVGNGFHSHKFIYFSFHREVASLSLHLAKLNDKLYKMYNLYMIDLIDR